MGPRPQGCALGYRISPRWGEWHGDAEQPRVPFLAPTGRHSIGHNKMAARVGASLLLAAGLGELVTSTYVEYEELAVSLALNPSRLLSMRRHLEGTRDTSAAFDTARWVRNMERGLSQVWDRHAAGLSPEDVDVTDTAPLFTSVGGAVDR